MMDLEFAEVEPAARRRSGWGSGPRFRRGELVEDIHALVAALQAGRWIYFNHKPQHPSVLMNMSLATLRGSLQAQRLRYALENRR